MDWNIEIFNLQRKRVAILDKAYNVGYSIEKNGLSTAEFTLKIDDAKNQYCKTFYYIKLYENGEYIDMFYILPSELVKDAYTQEITYRCEHVLGKLLDATLFRYHEIGGTGMYTPEILNYILSRQSDWILGRCDFKRQFQYSWENETLLSAVFSVPNPFDEDYMFTWDTTVYPWVINLIKPSNDVRAYARYKRNMKGIRKREDGSVVCTRLYPLGYGEGVNQLGIEGVNPTGKPYIDADTIGVYGVIEKIWVDLRYQIAENLFAAAQSKLEVLKQPKTTYEIDAAELWALTNIPIDKYTCGDIIRIIDEDTGIDVTTRIVSKIKSCIESDYISATIVTSSDDSNAAKGFTYLYERAKINETYAQGATNINNYNYYGNCDTKYPAKIRFKIPEEAVNINKVELSFQADAFRAFSKAIKGGGATVATTSAGGGTSSTTSDGGGTSSTTQSGGETSSTTQSGGGTQTTTESGGGMQSTTESGGGTQETSGGGVWFATPGFTSGFGATSLELSGSNMHGHVITADHSHNVTVPSHLHNVSVPAHRHEVNVPSHAHNFTLVPHDHNFAINPHAHSFTINAHSHSLTLNDHVHAIDYGIYEGPTAGNFKVTVDGAETTLTKTADGYNIVQYLKKDDGGKITRGWHEVLIFPDNLCMINADVMVQVFVNSRGGGNY